MIASPLPKKRRHCRLISKGAIIRRLDTTPCLILAHSPTIKSVTCCDTDLEIRSSEAHITGKNVLVIACDGCGREEQKKRCYREWIRGFKVDFYPIQSAKSPPGSGTRNRPPTKPWYPWIASSVLSAKFRRLFILRTHRTSSARGAQLEAAALYVRMNVFEQLSSRRGMYVRLSVCLYVHAILKICRSCINLASCPKTRATCQILIEDV